jgi:serine/threonine protein kinase
MIYEEEIYLRELMKGRDRGGSGKRGIIKIYNAFDMESTNGFHRCLVLELGGEYLPRFVTYMNYGFDDIVPLFKQCVEAVEYVHSQGISHGSTYIPLLGIQTGD